MLYRPSAFVSIFWIKKRWNISFWIAEKCRQILSFLARIATKDVKHNVWSCLLEMWNNHLKHDEFLLIILGRRWVVLTPNCLWRRWWGYLLSALFIDFPASQRFHVLSLCSYHSHKPNRVPFHFFCRFPPGPAASLRSDCFFDFAVSVARMTLRRSAFRGFQIEFKRSKEM